MRSRIPVSGVSAEYHLRPFEPQVPLLTRAQLARWLNVSVRHTYKVEADGCPRIQLGRSVRFEPTAVATFLASQPGFSRAVRPTPRFTSGPASPELVPSGISRGSPARVGLAQKLPAEAIHSLAPKLHTQATLRVGHRNRS